MGKNGITARERLILVAGKDLANQWILYPEDKRSSLTLDVIENVANAPSEGTIRSYYRGISYDGQGRLLRAVEREAERRYKILKPGAKIPADAPRKGA